MVIDRLIAFANRLRRSAVADTPLAQWSVLQRLTSHEVSVAHREVFLRAGYRARDFFPHRIRYLPKTGPDGSYLARHMAGITVPESVWQVVVHATSPAIDEFPRDIFFDRDLQWHQQHFHEPGQVASASMVIEGGILYSMAHQSDLVQRISRQRSLKTRVEKVFCGWHHMLLNAIARFATMRGCRELRVPTSRLMMRHTDRKRTVQTPLFERVYDRAVQHHFTAYEADGWWCIDLNENRARIVEPERRVRDVTRPRTICIVHDIERGLGHAEVDPAFARQADERSDAALTAMLDAERLAGVRATYVIVGSLMRELRDRVELTDGQWRSTSAGGHALGFHSYDHAPNAKQLGACRSVDYRLKGYRPPRSRLTPELNEETLCWYNFEWLGSAGASFRFNAPRLDVRVAKIPIRTDDHPLHTGTMDFASWRRVLVDDVRQRSFVAFGLHDCYASHWLPHYPSLLEELQRLGTLRTFDEVADEVFLAAAI